MAIREFLQKVFGWSSPVIDDNRIKLTVPGSRNLILKEDDYKYRVPCHVNLFITFLQHLNASFNILAYKIFSMAFWQKSLILFAFSRTKTLKFL